MPYGWPEKKDSNIAVVGRAKETLLIAAANFDPLGPWHVMLFGYGDDLSPM